MKQRSAANNAAGVSSQADVQAGTASASSNDTIIANINYSL
jgi:hypothetical protein